jgi:hypothetical protein
MIPGPIKNLREREAQNERCTFNNSGF